MNENIVKQVVVHLELDQQRGFLKNINATEGVAVNISLPPDGKNAANNGFNNNHYNHRYSTCSLLLQIGKLLGVVPSYAPSPRISSLFDKLLEKWCLQRDSYTFVRGISDVNDGDELLLCCGGYAKDSASNNSEVDFLELIPKKYNIVTVSLADNSSSTKKSSNASKDKKGNNNGGISAKNNCSIDNVDDDGDEDSDVEDVTDAYQSKKPSASQEVINLADDTSSDDDDDDDDADAKNRANSNSNNGNESESDTSREFYYSARDIEKSMSSDSDGSSSSVEDVTEISNSNGTKSENDTSRKFYNSAKDTKRESDGNDSSSSVEDVTEILMAKRKEQTQKKIDDAEEVHDSGGECAEDPKVGGKKRMKKAFARRSQSTAKRRKIVVAKSPIEVLIEEKDNLLCSGVKSKSAAGDDIVDRHIDIKQRIVRLISTGFREESDDHEARNAMRVARQLCQRHNLDHALLLRQRGDGSLNDLSTTKNDKDSSALQGGSVTVKIRKREDGKHPSRLSRWHDSLIKPVCSNFHVEAFHTFIRSTPYKAGFFSVTFYGIRTNAQLAAHAFKIASERIALMIATYEPPRNIYLPTRKQASETRMARQSYALDVVNGLEKDIEEGLQKEEALRKANLRKAQRAAKLDGAYHGDSYNDGNGLGNSSPAGINEQVYGDHALADDQIDPHSQSSHTKASFTAAEQLNKLEKENKAHLALVDHHKKVALDVKASSGSEVKFRFVLNPIKQR